MAEHPSAMRMRQYFKQEFYKETELSTECYEIPYLNHIDEELSSIQLHIKYFSMQVYGLYDFQSNCNRLWVCSYADDLVEMYERYSIEELHLWIVQELNIAKRLLACVGEIYCLVNFLNWVQRSALVDGSECNRILLNYHIYDKYEILASWEADENAIEIISLLRFLWLLFE